jgi:hydroxymethylpyrimidine pyrophosphatase-like HAD family hydrolase
MKISFDFDGTLDDEFGGILNPQKNEIQDIAKKYIEEGHQVCIITKRYGPEMSNMGLGNEHRDVLTLAKKLGISEVYFTNREMKFSHILALKIQRHFENSDYEVKLIEQVCQEQKHDCQVIFVEDPNWKHALNI